jgi:Domain of unknown function (DUF4124)
MKPLLVAGVGLLLLSSPAGAKPVYKCEEKGAVTYTDRPCTPGAAATELQELIVAQPPSRSQQDLARAHDARLERARSDRDRDDAAWLKQHGERKDREQRVRQAILAHKVIKGMTLDEVRQALGEPDAVDRGDSYGTAKETWTYAGDGQRRTVNFKDGQVTSTAGRTRRRR